MQTVAIAGVGLIGGSFALAIRRAGFTGTILGVSSPATVAEALAHGVIDEAATLEEACGRADLVYVAQPILRIVELLPRMAPHLKAGALVTDAGSTKARIVEAGRAIGGGALFLGGHPMAGKESRGAAAADAALFEGRPYVLTPESAEMLDEPRVAAFVGLLEAMGARPVILGAEEHDRLVAFTSHVPQLLSTALAKTLTHVVDYNKVAGPSLIDFTRLALSPYDMWKDILITNEANISYGLEVFIANLKQLQGNLTSDLSQTFDEARYIGLAVRKKP